MKTTKTMVPEACTAPVKKISTSKLKSIGAGILLLLAGLMGSGETRAQVSDSTIIDTTKTITVKPETSKGGDFSMDPTYSPTDKVGTVRLSGGGSVHGIGVGGFLDLTGTPHKPADASSAFGKLDVTKSTDSILKGTALDIQYILSSGGPDKVRGGFVYKIKLPSGKIILKFYPVSDKGFDPDILIGAGGSLGPKIGVGSFVETDIKSKCFHSETEATYKLTKHIDALAQLRVDGTYTSKPKAGAYLGARIKF